MKKRLSYFTAQLSPLDIGALFYVLLSGLYIAIGAPHLVDIIPHVILRLGIIILIFALIYLQKLYPNTAILFLRNLYPLAFLSFFYSETSYMKNILFHTNLDIYFSNADQYIWGFQPSLQFCKTMNQPWFNELMNICYFSYYLITAVICIGIYMDKKHLAYKPIFIAIFSFYLYYIIYDILPVTGPQFYFNTLPNESTPPYFFGKLMRYLLLNYEKPTGAFPSSHVGLALILSFIAWQHHKILFWVSIPFVIGICFATVYLKAHYAVDVLAALITVPVFIYISNMVYKKLLLLNTSSKRKQVKYSQKSIFLL